MCPDAVLCRTQAEVDAELDRLGLTMVSVKGDGNCLFRALEEMDSSRTHVEWRAFLVQKIREMAIKDPAFANRCLVSGNDVWGPVGWKQPVDKKNKPIRVPGRYKDFEDLMTKMSKLGEWGFTEFVEVFAEVQDAAFLCFANDGKNPAMVRSSSTSIIKKLFYTWNLLNPATAQRSCLSCSPRYPNEISLGFVCYWSPSGISSWISALLFGCSCCSSTRAFKISICTNPVNC